MIDSGIFQSPYIQRWGSRLFFSLFPSHRHHRHQQQQQQQRRVRSLVRSRRCVL